MQVFAVQPGRDTMLVGLAGTKLVLPARAFDVPAGSGPVRLQMQEYIRTADIVLAGLSTTTGPDLLETGGMLHLRATVAGRLVRLRPEAIVLFQFRSRTSGAAMDLYEGVAPDAGPFVWRRPGVPTDAGQPWERFGGQLTNQSLLGNVEGPGPRYDRLLGYDLTGGVLNWINCDRLLNPGPRIPFDVPAPDSTTYVALVFKKQRCILAGEVLAGNVTRFAQVPAGAVATVVALRRQGGAVYLATHELELKPTAKPVLRFRLVTLNQFRDEMERL